MSPTPQTDQAVRKWAAGADLHPTVIATSKRLERSLRRSKTVWLVEIQCGEGIALPPQFDTEVYSLERSAIRRAAKLNMSKPPHCGYWFIYSAARTINRKNKDWS